MDRDTAVQRIKDGLGFRTGTGLDATIVLRLQEAQRNLEKGKTLPRFLLQIDQTLTLSSGAHTVALPTGFLRESDETRIRFLPANSTLPRFLERKLYIDAIAANVREVDTNLEPIEPVAPSVYVIRKGESTSVIDFITEADQAYTLYWDYYKAGDLLTTNIENEWLANASEWLIGEAGKRIARDTRNMTAVELFEEMRREGRAAVFGEEIVAELASGPYVMGANL